MKNCLCCLREKIYQLQDKKDTNCKLESEIRLKSLSTSWLLLALFRRSPPLPLHFFRWLAIPADDPTERWTIMIKFPQISSKKVKHSDVLNMDIFEPPLYPDKSKRSPDQSKPHPVKSKRSPDKPKPHPDTIQGLLSRLDRLYVHRRSESTMTASI